MICLPFNKIMPTLILAGFVLLGSLNSLNAANLVEFSLRNQHSNDDCSEYYAELWATVAPGEEWQIAESDISVSYNTDALSAPSLSPAFEANQSLVDEGVSINQVPDVDLLRISLLKSSGFVAKSGSFKIATFNWDIEDAAENDDLAFATTSPSTKIFDNTTQLRVDCGETSCFGVVNPVTRQIAKIDITDQPRSLVVCEAEEASFSIDARGCDLSYDWQMLIDGSWESTGVESATLSFDEANADDAGSYRVVVSGDDAGDQISNTITLTVNIPPSIDAAPEDVTICENGNASFNVEVAGEPEPTIQWQRDTGEGWENLEGENSATLQYENVPGSWNAYQFRALVSNVCDEIVSDAATLTVNTAPVFDVDNFNQLVCEGDEAVFEPELSGRPEPEVQWQVNRGDEWENLEDANGNVLTLSGVSIELDGYRYRAVAENSCGEKISAEATLTIFTIPSISEEPEDILVCLGDEASFSVEVEGNPAPTIQWQWRFPEDEDWQAIEDANDPTLTFSPLQEDNSKLYRALVNNRCGTASAEAQLTVVVGPRIEEEFSEEGEIFICEGERLELDLQEVGTDLEYLWLKDGEELEDFSEATLVIEEVSLEDEGSYEVIISNVCGELSSEAVDVIVRFLPEVSEEPESQEVCIGGDAEFTVEVEGSNTSIQWQFGDGEEWVDLNDEIGATLSIPNAQLTDAGLYRARVTGDCAPDAFSDEVELVVAVEALIVEAPMDQTICESSTTTLSINATGTNLRYQWMLNDEDIEGANEARYALSPAQAGDAGQYTVRVSNVCGSVVSEAATVVINLLPAVEEDPRSQTVCEGELAAFTADLRGSGMELQWQYDDGEGWEDIEGANDARFTIDNTTTDDAGSYRIRVRGICAPEAFSEAAELVVNRLPAITRQPESVTVCETESTILSVGADGTDIRYQWYHNGSAIEGADAADLRINPAELDDAGRYTVEIAGICEPAVMSVAVTVDVTPLPVITQQPRSQAICLGGGATFTVAAAGPASLDYVWEFSRFGRDWSIIPDENEATLNFAATTQDNEGFYRVTVDGACPKTTRSEEAELVIYDPVNIVIQPQDERVCVGEDIILLVGALGTPLSGNENEGLKYEWFHDGSKVPGGFRKELTISNVSPDDEGDYRVLVTGRCSEVWSESVKLTVQPTPVASINAPKNVRVLAGETVSYEVNSNCLPGATFQWFKGGVALADNDRISGANTSRLTISNVGDADRGSNYFCVVNCECGEARSDRASLEIDIVDIEFTGHPQDVGVCDGEQVCFTVEWESFGQEVDIQWLDADDNPVAGANDATYCPENYSDGDAYKVRLSLRSDGSVTTVSDLGRISVALTPQISRQPDAIAVCHGDPASFNVTISNDGVEGTSYQWYFDGTMLPDATESSFSIDNSDDAQLGTYYVVISNDCGSTQSESVSLSFLEATAISQQPSHPKAGDPFDFGEEMTLTVEASGDGNCVYQWQYSDDQGGSWTDLANGNENSYSNHLGKSEEGWYRVVITCNCGQVASEPVAVTVDGTVGVDHFTADGLSFSLGQNYPNPFDGSTTIEYTLQRPMRVELLISDVLGQVLARPLAADQNSGTHELQLNAEQLRLPAGTYNYTLKADGRVLTRQMIVIK